MSLASMKPLQV